MEFFLTIMKKIIKKDYYFTFVFVIFVIYFNFSIKKNFRVKKFIEGLSSMKVVKNEFNPL